MNERLGSIAVHFLEFMATYWLHSFCILLVTWIIVNILRNLSAATKQRIWQVACVAGLATASFQFLGNPQNPITSFQNAFSRSVWEEDSFDTTMGNNGSVASEVRKIEDARKSNDAGMELPELNPALGNSFGGQTGELEGPVLLLKSDATNSPSHAESEDLGQHPSPPNIGSAKTVISAAMDANEVELTPSSDDQPMISANYRIGISPSLALLAAITLVVWILAAGLATCWQLVVLWRRKKSLRDLENARILSIFQTFLAERDIKAPIRLLQSPAVNQPFAFGLINKSIVLNPSLGDHLDDREIEGLLAHEVAHLVRGDWCWMVVGRLFCTCLIFQPLNILARRQWLACSEEACDQWAVRQGVKPIALARCLTKIAEWQNIGRPSIALAALGGSSFIQRVESLLNGKRLGSGFSGLQSISATVALSSVLALVAFCPCPKLYASLGSDEIANELPSGSLVDAPQPTDGQGGSLTTSTVPGSVDELEKNDSELLENWKALDAEILELKEMIDYAESLVPNGHHGVSKLLGDLRKRLQELDSRRAKVRQ